MRDVRTEVFLFWNPKRYATRQVTMTFERMTVERFFGGEYEFYYTIVEINGKIVLTTEVDDIDQFVEEFINENIHENEVVRY